MKKTTPITVLAIIFTALSSAIGIPLSTPNGIYTQSFDSLPTTGSGPSDNAWIDNSTIQGWYADQETGNLTNIRAGTGSSSTGALYSFGSTGSTDRALGSVGSGTPDDIAWGLLLSNETGSTITFGSLSYTGEQWRVGGPSSSTPSDPQSVTFSYRISETLDTSLDPNTDAGWTLVNLLNFTSPTTTPPVGAIDGNVAGNRIEFSLDLGLGLAAGSSVMFRWRDIDHTSNDHGLSIDDFSIEYSAAAVPESGTTLHFLGLAAFGLILFRRFQT